jgi:predicted transposase/invertase (TIGR01784 family)
MPRYLDPKTDVVFKKIFGEHPQLLKSQTIEPQLLQVPEIKQAVELSEESGYTPGELAAYDKYWDSVSTEKTLIKGYYDQGLQRGHEQGLQQGLEQGHEQGLQQGLEQGLQQGAQQNKLLTARKLLEMGMEPTLIAKITELPLEQIKVL